MGDIGEQRTDANGTGAPDRFAADASATDVSATDQSARPAKPELNMALLRKRIAEWLEEDAGGGDVTSAAVLPPDAAARGFIHVKEDAVLAGLPAAREVFRMADPAIDFAARAEEGAFVAKGTVIAEVAGPARSILTAERLALNLLQRMSGIATATRRFVDAVRDFPGVRIVDTRKTTPGHRFLEKYAVRIGGGHNHRFGLSDAVMIKDNHIKAAGGIRAAVARARAAIPHTMTVEVETETLAQVEEALEAGADIIMLDNMPLEEMREAVRLIKGRSPRTIVEASGGVRLETVRAIAETGVDVISAGSLTHSVRAVDISLDLGDIKASRRERGDWA
jgi:nicotinate-nucleotide pyrophosphorylase (carboxylating)